MACPTCHVTAGAHCITRTGKPAREPHGCRFEALEQAAGITEHRAAARREAEARGGWLVALDPKAEGALLTAYAARAQEPAREPIVARARFRREDLDRINAVAATEREAYRARMDERQAVEHRAHGAPVPDAVQARIEARRATERHVVEGSDRHPQRPLEGHRTQAPAGLRRARKHPVQRPAGPRLSFEINLVHRNRLTWADLLRCQRMVAEVRGKREPGVRPAHHGGAWQRHRCSCTRLGPNRPY